jgi:uncharacterized RDD family membrane protein YckC
MSDADSDVFNELLIAKWSDRFVAWLIDFIIISAISASIAALTFGITSSVWNVDSTSGITNFEWDENSWFFGSSSILFFAYWIISEYKGGQSIGKKILHLKVVNIDGKSAPILGVIISSFGKAFLLPIDLILGVIFTNQKRQRIFNKIGDTIVIKIKDAKNDSENIRYKKD